MAYPFIVQGNNIFASAPGSFTDFAVSDGGEEAVHGHLAGEELSVDHPVKPEEAPHPEEHEAERPRQQRHPNYAGQ